MGYKCTYFYWCTKYVPKFYIFIKYAGIYSFFFLVFTFFSRSTLFLCAIDDFFVFLLKVRVWWKRGRTLRRIRPEVTIWWRGMAHSSLEIHVPLSWRRKRRRSVPIIVFAATAETIGRAIEVPIIPPFSRILLSASR